jgi:hypothetical protein
MDVATAVATAFGLAGAAGLNAWLPVVAAAVLDRAGVVDLAAPFDQLSTTPALVILGVVFVADFVGDKIPAVDFTGQTGAETDLPTAAAILLGAVTAGSVHLGRATLRPASTVTTGGVANPILSLSEDAASGILVAAAFLVPLLALALTIALVAAIALGLRRLRRGRRPRLSR